MFDPTTFTGFHTWLSLIAIASGILVVAGLLGGRGKPVTTALFLFTAILTSGTGFGFPFNGVLPSHIVGAIALLVLAVAVIARYGRHMMGAWRRVYAITAVISLYFLVFVAVAQAFQKVPALRALAPTGAEPPFAIAQVSVLVAFIALGYFSARRFSRITVRSALA
ncbi:hypothetical protein [Roseixanthobacter liquoris]|uniref:hypothetical protein n=1 Tax=Roseixanthobacter liquoris TaxID=3119921 RepID=UPI003729A7DD